MEKVVTMSDHTREPEVLASSVKVTQEVPRSRRRSGHVNSKLYKKNDDLSSTFQLLAAAAFHSQRNRAAGVRP